MDRSFPSCTTEHVHQQRQNGGFRDEIQRSNRVWICCCCLMKRWLIMVFLHKICTRPFGRLVSQFYPSLGCFHPSGTTGRVVSSNTARSMIIGLIFSQIPTLYIKYMVCLLRLQNFILFLHFQLLYLGIILSCYVGLCFNEIVMYNLCVWYISRSPWTSMAVLLQGWFYGCAQPMRDFVAK